MRRTRIIRAIAAVTVLAVAGLTQVDGVTPTSAQAQLPDRPNILIILTDDQRVGEETMQMLPRTKAIFANRGQTFTNAVATTPLCCPSRASIYSGQYAHNHNVKHNTAGRQFDPTHSMQYELEQEGYQTAYSGKYLNASDDTPPYFDQWAVHARLTDYKKAPFNVNGQKEIAHYVTTFTAQKAREFLRDFEANDDAPWLLYVAPFAPHMPAIPQGIYKSDPVPRWDGNPATRETDRRDKPPGVKSSNRKFRKALEMRRLQLRSLKSVDDLVESVFAQVNTLNEEDTLAFFLSDNGFMWAEHKLVAKRHPYSPSVRIPFYMRWPGHVNPGSRSNEIVANIDIAPTVYEMLGIVPDYTFDGRSLLSPEKRERILIEYWWEDDDPNAATYKMLWAPGAKYVEYRGGFREFYKAEDRWELTNVYGNGRRGDEPPNEQELETLLDVYSTCSGLTCP